MVKLTLYQNDANHLSALEYAITRFANDRVAEMVEAEIDCLEDGASLDYFFPRRIELYHPELKRPILYELWDAVCSNVVYDHLSPLKQFVMYQIIEEYRLIKRLVFISRTSKLKRLMKILFLLAISLRILNTMYIQPLKMGN